MTSEIRLAFEHPDARSKAGAPEIADRISLRDHIVEVDIGAFQQERGNPKSLLYLVVEVRPLLAKSPMMWTESCLMTKSARRLQWSLPKSG